MHTQNITQVSLQPVSLSEKHLGLHRGLPRAGVHQAPHTGAVDVGSVDAPHPQVLKSLNKTYQNMKRKPVAVDLDPKAVTCDELFGIINPATREWKDGRSHRVWSATCSEAETLTCP